MRGLSPVATSGGPSSSRCVGLSPSRPLLSRGTGSRRAGSVVVAHGPSCSAACGILPDQGSNPCALHWQADSQPLRHQGSPNSHFFSNCFSVNFFGGDLWYLIISFAIKNSFTSFFPTLRPLIAFFCLIELAYFFLFLFFTFVIYLFIYIFIYLFMAVLGLCFCARAFSSCGKRGPLFIAVRGPLTITASPVAEHRL